MQRVSEISDDMIDGLVEEDKDPYYTWEFFETIYDFDLFGSVLMPGDAYCDIDLIIKNPYGHHLLESWMPNTRESYNYVCFSCHASILKSAFPYFTCDLLSKKVEGYRRRFHLIEEDPMIIIKCIECVYLRHLKSISPPNGDILLMLQIGNLADYLQKSDMQRRTLKLWVEYFLKGSSIKEILQKNTLTYYKKEEWNNENHFIIVHLVTIMGYIPHFIVDEACVKILKNIFLHEATNLFSNTYKFGYDVWELLATTPNPNCQYYINMLNLMCIREIVHIISSSGIKTLDLPEEIIEHILFWNHHHIHAFVACCAIRSAKVSDCSKDRLWIQCLILLIVWARPKNNDDIYVSAQKMERLIQIVGSSDMDILLIDDTKFDSYIPFEDFASNIVSIYKKNLQIGVSLEIEEKLLCIIKRSTKRVYGNRRYDELAM